MARVNLPPGCYGLQVRGDRQYNNAPGSKRGFVEIDDRSAKQVNNSFAGRNGTLYAGTRTRIATKRGRRCPSCRFLAQVWSTECPRCNTPTVEED